MKMNDEQLSKEDEQKLKEWGQSYAQSLAKVMNDFNNLDIKDVLKQPNMPQGVLHQLD